MTPTLSRAGAAALLGARRRPWYGITGWSSGNTYVGTADQGYKGAAAMSMLVFYRLDSVPSATEVVAGNDSAGNNGYRVYYTSGAVARSKVADGAGSAVNLNGRTFSASDVGYLWSHGFTLGNGDLIQYLQGVIDVGTFGISGYTASDASAAPYFGSYYDGSLSSTAITGLGWAVTDVELTPAEMWHWERACRAAHRVVAAPRGTTQLGYDVYSGAQSLPSAWAPFAGTEELDLTGSGLSVAELSEDFKVITASGSFAPFLSAPGSYTPPGGTVNISPAGDSLTADGGGVVGAYRDALEDLLVADALTFDFVGPYSSGPASLSDKDHAGVSGNTLAQIEARIASDVTAYSPDLVLLMGGTNDCNAASSVDKPTAYQRLDSLLDTIVAGNPSATTIVGTIPPMGDAEDNAWAHRYNLDLRRIVLQHQHAGEKIYCADVGGAVSISDLTDGVHPDAAGYAKMAAAWADAIKAVTDAS